MHNAMNSQYKYDLLKLSDFYYDELCDLFADFYNIEDYSEMEDEKIDELFSIENYKKILENKEVPKRIKECIELYLECNKVCKELETIIIKKDWWNKLTRTLNRVNITHNLRERRSCDEKTCHYWSRWKFN